MKKEFKLFNVMFPIWFFYIFPATCIALIIPGNFIIDSLVLIISAYVLKIENKFKFYKSTILKVFCCGLAADIVGALIMFLLLYTNLMQYGDEFYITLPVMLFSSVLIYFFNYKLSFKTLEKKKRVALSLIFAIATAPYTFLIPTEWIY
ncbi:MAG: hypothetical protein IIU65_03540 [Clostridia bacterium]|nr:hypothetical protein [Clostridia bacterium]